MSIQIKSEKHLRWEQLEQTMAHVKDKLGKPIDQGIMETVIVLNALEISTVASCEGHLDWGVSAPWVDIVSQHPAAQVQVGKLFSDAAKVEARGDLSQEQIRTLYADLHRQRREIKAYHLQEREKLMQYLAAFYENRHVPFDQRLIICPLGTDGRSRLESQGADSQEVALLDIRTQKLLVYQEEMRTFTSYLKQSYFDG
jgi:hypothetical protein